jgi:hypothetical protein
MQSLYKQARDLCAEDKQKGATEEVKNDGQKYVQNRVRNDRHEIAF